jgi:hypothetical protein
MVCGFSGCLLSGRVEKTKLENSTAGRFNLTPPNGLGKPFSVTVKFPDETYADELDIAFDYEIEADEVQFHVNKLRVKKPLTLEVSETLVRKEAREIYITLDWSKEGEAQFYDSPVRPQTSEAQLRTSVGRLEFAKTLLYIFESRATCFGTWVSPTHVLTALHCANTDNECDHISFQWTDDKGSHKAVCAKRVVADQDLDQVLLEMKDIDSPPQSLSFAPPLRFRTSTPVITTQFTSQKTTTFSVCGIGREEANIRNHGESGVGSADETILLKRGYLLPGCSSRHGDSGGPIVNFDGEIVGVTILVRNGEFSLGGSRIQVPPETGFSTVSPKILEKVNGR